MKIIMEFLKGDAASALGWALLHSVWQGLLIWLLVLVVLRLTPAIHARFPVLATTHVHRRELSEQHDVP